MPQAQEGDFIVKKNNFHDSIKFIIKIAQYFGVMPLQNLNKTWDLVYFDWRSLKVVYSILNACGAFITFGFWLVKFWVDGLVVDQTGATFLAHMAFYISTFLCSLHLIKLAKHWNEILNDWSYIEMSMRGYVNDVNLKKRYLWMTATSFTLGTIEHVLFVVNGIYVADACASYVISPLRATMEVLFNNYFTFITFNVWLGVLVKIDESKFGQRKYNRGRIVEGHWVLGLIAQDSDSLRLIVINILSTFTWIFTDVFISLISVALTAKFRQLVMRLKKNKVMHHKFWREIRQDYHKLYILCKKMDKHISFLVLISYMHNIFFLCIQLYNSLRERKGVAESTYFVFSFSFLVSRIIAVSMYGAWLHDEAKKPMEYLYNVPTEYYCTEISRLIEQIYTNPIGITGSGFFIVTRNFLLQMAGTIVTFELMLFQFAPLNSKYRAYNRSESCI